jgi:hypothetical protein
MKRIHLKLIFIILIYMHNTYKRSILLKVLLIINKYKSVQI